MRIQWKQLATLVLRFRDFANIFLLCLWPRKWKSKLFCWIIACLWKKKLCEETLWTFKKWNLSLLEKQKKTCNQAYEAINWCCIQHTPQIMQDNFLLKISNKNSTGASWKGLPNWRSICLCEYVAFISLERCFHTNSSEIDNLMVFF